jgi:dihydroneopterin aldolase
MGIIKVSGIRLHSFHGCLPEEAKIGGEFIVDVLIDTDFSAAEKSDKLHDTIDYCEVYAMVKTEMAIRSKLIEEVCRRILDKLLTRFPAAGFEVSITKLRPPMNGDVESVSVLLSNRRI